MIPVALAIWASRWSIPPQALADLQSLLVHEYQGEALAGSSEAYVSSAVRLDEARRGNLIWRNNVGALKDPAGRWVRFGLCNDSARLNEKLKSSDLIGITPVVITPAHVGQTIGQFTALEAKEAGWKFTGTPREVAQAAYGQLVITHGGRFAFTTGPGVL